MDAGARPLEDGDVETADLQPLSAPDAALRKAMADLGMDAHLDLFGYLCVCRTIYQC